MDHPFSELAALYRFHGRMLGLLAADFTEADWRARTQGNSAQWVLAHLVTSKRSLLRALGDGMPAEAWEALSRRGGAPDAVLPDGSALLAAWRQANDALADRLAALTPEEGARPAPRTMPDGGTTLGAMARFLQFHEAYHFGQLGLLRRFAGKPGAI